MYIIRLLIIYSHEHTNDAGHHRCPHQNTIICGQMCVYVCVGVLRILQTKPPQHRRRWLRPSTRKNKTCIIAHAAWLCFVFILGSLSRIPQIAPRSFAIYIHKCAACNKRGHHLGAQNKPLAVCSTKHTTHTYIQTRTCYMQTARWRRRGRTWLFIYYHCTTPL